MLLTGLSLLAVALAGGALLEFLGNKAIKNLPLILAFGLHTQEYAQQNTDTHRYTHIHPHTYTHQYTHALQHTHTH